MDFQVNQGTSHDLPVGLHRPADFAYVAQLVLPDGLYLMKKTLALMLASSLLAGCSFYTTNSDLRFENTRLDRKLPIPVGEPTEPADQLTFLGWVDAYVQKPNVMAADPTRLQVDHVLAHLAKQRGADAVIHVSYKEAVGMNTLKRLEARGQAVRFNSRHANNKTTPESFTSVAVTTALPPSDKLRLTEQLNTQPVDMQSAYQTPAEQAPATPVAKPLPAAVTTADTATRKQLTDSNYTGQRDALTEQRDRLQLMLNNARFLQKKAEEHNDKDMQNSAMRLIQLLESQQRYFDSQEQDNVR